MGIYFAALKLNIRLSKELGRWTVDVFERRFRYSEARPARRFLLMLMLSFAPMLVWLLPIGGKGFFYELLRSTAFNGTLLDDGVFLAVTGALLLVALRQLTLGKNNKGLTVAAALAAGVCSVALVSVSGLSLIGGVFAVLVLCGISKKTAYRFALEMSIPVLLVMGIIELATAAYKASAVQIIIGLVLSAVFAFLCARVLRWLINKGTLKYVALYDVFIGAITAVIGIVQLIIR